MSKITVKLQTNTSKEDAEFLVNLAHNFAPERDLEVIWCDDPSLSVVVHERAAPVTATVAHGYKDFSPHTKPDGGTYGRD